MEIELNNLKLSGYDEENIKHKQLLSFFDGKSKSDYIHDIGNRLINSKSKNDSVFDSGYVVSFNNQCIDYVFISKIISDEIFLEYSLLKEMRGKGFVKLILSDISDYLLDNYNVKSILLDIDPSNVPSVMTAISCGYIEDDEEYLKRNMSGKILYRRDNYNYINKRKK